MLSFYESLSNSLILNSPALQSLAIAAAVVFGLARISLSSVMSVTIFKSFVFSFIFGVSDG